MVNVFIMLVAEASRTPGTKIDNTEIGSQRTYV